MVDTTNSVIKTNVIIAGIKLKVSLGSTFDAFIFFSICTILKWVKISCRDWWVCFFNQR